MIFLSICLFHLDVRHVPFSSLTKLPETNRRMTKKRDMEKRRCRRAEIESRHQNLKFKTGETSNLGKETAGPLCRELASAIEKGPGGKKVDFSNIIMEQKGKEKILLRRTVLNNRNILEKVGKNYSVLETS